MRWIRLRLRRHDGGIYLDRWGVEHDRIGGVFLHRMNAPDPGVDLHDHPWSFVTIVLAGGYIEERAPARVASQLAHVAEKNPKTTHGQRGDIEQRDPWRARLMRLDECHRITALAGRHCWTLVIHGPTRRRWGFYLPTKWIDEHAHYSLHVERRPLAELS